MNSPVSIPGKNKTLSERITSNLPTEVAHTKIVAESHKYMIQGKPVGDLQFKLLTQKVATYKQETVSRLIENITNHKENIATVNSIIDNFNQHVKVRL